LALLLFTEKIYARTKSKEKHLLTCENVKVFYSLLLVPYGFTATMAVNIPNGSQTIAFFEGSAVYFTIQLMII